MAYIEQLMNNLKLGKISLQWEQDPEVADLVKWKAFRTSDKATLQSIHPWNYTSRPYKVDPLPERMAIAFSDFLFGEDPLVTSADEADQEFLKDLIQSNHFGSRLRAAADLCVSEREVWWRIYIDPQEAMWPILSWHSRAQVIPLVAGQRVLAVGFINDLGRLEKDAPYFRHIEFHEDGVVRNLLFKSQGPRELGNEVALSDHPATAFIAPQWMHGLEILAGMVRNEEEKRSIFQGVESLLLDLNEAHTIDSENFRLAGKKRAVMPRKYQDQSGNVSAGEEIFWVEDDFNEMEADQGPFKILEYSYDGASSIARKDDLCNTILTRVGLARQLVDASANEGLAQTGTALRTRLLPTLAAIKGKSKEWSDKLPLIIRRLQEVDALPEGSLGFGRSWSLPNIPPAVHLSPPLPQDMVEEAQRHQTLIQAELESIETAIEELRPGWSSQRRMLEVRRILANRAGYAIDDEGNPVTAETTSPVPPGEGSKEALEAVPGSSRVESAQEAGKQQAGSRPPQQGAGVGAG